MNEKEVEKLRKKAIQEEEDSYCVKAERDRPFARLRKSRKKLKTWE